MNNFNVINLWPNVMSHSQFTNDILPIKELVLNEFSNSEHTKESTTTVNGKQVQQISHTTDPWIWPHEDLQPVKTFIEESLKQYKQTIYPHIEVSTDPIIKRSWAIVYDEGGYQEPHCHPHMDISGLLTLQTSTEGGEIVFTNPAIQSSYTNFQPYSHKFKPEAGDLILWPAWWLHYTLPTVGPDQKIVISFDARLH